MIFLFLSDLMVAMISSFSGCVVLTSRPVSGSCTSASIVGGGPLGTSLKCSAHLASCYASMVSSLPWLSTIGMLVALWYFPLTRLVMLYMYTCACPLPLAASSAWLSRSPMVACLSSLVILFTVWSASKHCCLSLSFSLSDLVS